ncbi:MAG: phosphotransferase [Rhizomicrobium sp.]
MTPREQAEELREVGEALAGMGLVADGEPFALMRLAGGVSCDIWRVEAKGRPPVVVKRALEKLNVAADWRAPPERSGTEVAWIRLVSTVDPRWVPKILGEDRARHMFAMQFLPPQTYPVWKNELAAGRIDIGFGGAAGAALARIHGATAGRADIADAFAHGAQFQALRLEPYLLFTGERHPPLAMAIRDEAGRLAAARIALMQGDISPKNILCGPDGPVFLDAETACFGDPAFDLAFCLNHFLLKAVWHPEWSEQYAQAFAAMKTAYLAGRDLGEGARHRPPHGAAAAHAVPRPRRRKVAGGISDRGRRQVLRTRLRDADDRRAPDQSGRAGQCLFFARGAAIDFLPAVAGEESHFAGSR